MTNFKYLVATGAYYFENGSRDIESWQKQMIDDIGPAVIPFLVDIKEWALVAFYARAGPQNIKKNCWEIKNCERQSDGELRQEFGTCPAAIERKIDGIHGGKNGGRACWTIPQTLCGGRIQRTAIQKCLACTFCDFRKMVSSEEGQDFMISDDLLKKLIQ